MKPSDVEPDVGPFSYLIEYFFELSTCRYPDQAIPWTSIYKFSKINNEDDFQGFLYIIRVLDNVYLRQREKERNKK